jgi:hypothetical protein
MMNLDGYALSKSNFVPKGMVILEGTVAPNFG